jgi:hypothetical protein
VVMANADEKPITKQIQNRRQGLSIDSFFIHDSKSLNKAQKSPAAPDSIRESNRATIRMKDNRET